MKKYLLILVTALFIACNPFGGDPFTENQQGFVNEMPPVSITMHQIESGEIESFSADVEEYTMNDRSLNGPQMVSNYRLTMKNVNGRLLARMDFPEDFDGQTVARTLLTDGESVVLASGSMVIGRISLEESGVSFPAHQLSNQRIMGRVNIEEIRTQYRNLSYDIAEDDSVGIMEVRVPLDFVDHHIPGIESIVMRYDTNNETYLGSEMVQHDEEGNERTYSQQMIYQEHEGEQIVVGQVNSVHYDFSGNVDTEGYSYPIIDDPDSVPEITEEEMNEIIEEGGNIIEPEPILGDPSNPDYTETTVTTFNNIVLNDTEDSTFRLILE